jgi:pimeloyl-ACP methyl ester carboxylesterase
MAPSLASTAFVLVPGGFCPPSFWHKVTDKLTSLGYPVTPVELPTFGNAAKPPATMSDDAAAVRAAATVYMDAGRNVVIASNSYGGFVATESVKELSDAERSAAGKKGGRLANLVLIGVIAPIAGLTCTELLTANGAVEEIPELTEEQVFMDAPPPEAAAGLVSELSLEEALVYGKQLQRHRTAAFHEKLTWEGYLHVPSTFVVTLKDIIVNVEKQKESIDEAVRRGNGNVRRVDLDNGDHCAMISRSEEIVQILLDAAKV